MKLRKNLNKKNQVLVTVPEFILSPTTVIFSFHSVKYKTIYMPKFKITITNLIYGAKIDL